MRKRMDGLPSDIVILEPLSLEHAAELHALSPLETFRYFTTRPRDGSLAAFEEFLGGALADTSREGFVVRDRANGRVVGSTSFLDIRPAHRGLEIGFTWYDPACRGTRINPACKALMLERAFDERGCVRVQLKCDNRNELSKRAISKLGAVFEGVLRKHMIMPDGFIRDTAMFSITPEEWPTVRAGLRARLATPA